MLAIASAITPMRYPIDLLRGLYYGDAADAARVVLLPVTTNLAIIVLAGLAFVLFGTMLFVRNERNR